MALPHMMQHMVNNYGPINAITDSEVRVAASNLVRKATNVREQWKLSQRTRMDSRKRVQENIKKLRDNPTMGEAEIQAMISEVDGSSSKFMEAGNAQMGIRTTADLKDRLTEIEKEQQWIAKVERRWEDLDADLYKGDQKLRIGEIIARGNFREWALDNGYTEDELGQVDRDDKGLIVNYVPGAKDLPAIRHFAWQLKNPGRQRRLFSGHPTSSTGEYVQIVTASSDGAKYQHSDGKWRAVGENFITEADYKVRQAQYEKPTVHGGVFEVPERVGRKTRQKKMFYVRTADGHFYAMDPTAPTPSWSPVAELPKGVSAKDMTTPMGIGTVADGGKGTVPTRYLTRDDILGGKFKPLGEADAGTKNLGLLLVSAGDVEGITSQMKVEEHAQIPEDFSAIGYGERVRINAISVRDNRSTGKAGYWYKTQAGEVVRHAPDTVTVTRIDPPDESTRDVLISRGAEAGFTKLQTESVALLQRRDELIQEQVRHNKHLAMLEMKATKLKDAPLAVTQAEIAVVKQARDKVVVELQANQTRQAAIQKMGLHGIDAPTEAPAAPETPTVVDSWPGTDAAKDSTIYEMSDGSFVIDAPTSEDQVVAAADTEQVDLLKGMKPPEAPPAPPALPTGKPKAGDTWDLTDGGKATLQEDGSVQVVKDEVTTTIKAGDVDASGVIKQWVAPTPAPEPSPPPPPKPRVSPSGYTLPTEYAPALEYWGTGGDAEKDKQGDIFRAWVLAKNPDLGKTKFMGSHAGGKVAPAKDTLGLTGKVGYDDSRTFQAAWDMDAGDGKTYGQLFLEEEKAAQGGGAQLDVQPQAPAPADREPRDVIKTALAGGPPVEKPEEPKEPAPEAPTPEEEEEVIAEAMEEAVAPVPPPSPTETDIPGGAIVMSQGDKDEAHQLDADTQRLKQLEVVTRNLVEMRKFAQEEEDAGGTVETTGVA